MFGSVLFKPALEEPEKGYLFCSFPASRCRNRSLASLALSESPLLTEEGFVCSVGCDEPICIVFSEDAGFVDVAANEQTLGGG